MIDATGTRLAKGIAIHVEVQVGMYCRTNASPALSGNYLSHTFTTTFPITDGPKNAKQRREAFLSVLQWKWANLGWPEKYPVAARTAICAEIREGANLGRTPSWKASIENLDMYVWSSGDTSFTIMQHTHFAFLRNS